MSTPVAEGTGNPVGALLVGAAAPAVAALALLAGGAALAGGDQSRSALAGGGMALVAMATGPALHQLCRRLDPTMTTGLVVMAYCVVIIALGVGYSSLSGTAWLVGEFAAAGVFVVAAGWTVGQIRASLRLRQPLYLREGTTARR